MDEPNDKNSFRCACNISFIKSWEFPSKYSSSAYVQACGFEIKHCVYGSAWPKHIYSNLH